MIHPTPKLFFPTIGIRVGPSEESWSLKGRFVKIGSLEGAFSIKPPLFNGNKFFEKLEWEHFCRNLE